MLSGSGSIAMMRAQGKVRRAARTNAPMLAPMSTTVFTSWHTGDFRNGRSWYSSPRMTAREVRNTQLEPALAEAAPEGLMLTPRPAHAFELNAARRTLTGQFGVTSLEGFERYDPQGEMMKKKFIHYPKSGNRMVARYILDYLEKERMGTERARASRE